MRGQHTSAVAIAALVFAGCAVAGLGRASTSDLINGAAYELAHATGLELEGAFTKDKTDMSVDIQTNPPHSAHITASKQEPNSQAIQVEMIQIDQKDYYRSVDLARVAAAASASAELVAHMVGGRWFTYKATPLDLGVSANTGDIKASFLTDLSVARKDDVDVGGQGTAELSTGNYLINITEAAPHRLVFLRTAAGKTVKGLSLVHMLLRDYNKDFAIKAPTIAVDLDDPASWPPLYSVLSVENSRCGTPCTLSAQIKNLGGGGAATEPSTLTFEVINSATKQVLGSCAVTIRPDLAHNQTATERCTISSSAWTNFRGSYTYGAKAHNPAYD